MARYRQGQDRGPKMAKLTKTQSQLYVENEGEYPSKYYGTPQSLWFIADQPAIQAWVDSKHKLDFQNEVWNQFTPNGEAFSPIGLRPPLAFQTNEPMRRSISATLRPGKYVSLGKIGEDGLSPFDGSIEFHAKGDGGEYSEPSHGSVWLAPAHNDLGKETIYISLVLEHDQLESVCREMVTRPDAVLSIRLKFAAYQHEIEQRVNSGQGMFRLEPDAHIPIIEAKLAVVDLPENTSHAAAADLPVEPASVVPIVVQPNLSSFVVRINWALGLLALLILVMLFR
jgi:hypothetical protein